MTTGLLPSGGAQAPIDVDALARMASAMFSALPGDQLRTAGVQAPINLAPAGSPLASPAGLGPSVPGTPIPQGQVPGTNLIPASPTAHASLAHRAPALLPHAADLGAYQDCSFAAPGEGTFTPLHGAEPFIGSEGQQERVREQRLELLVDRKNVPRAVKSLLAAHPYEEPAFDLYPLLNEGEKLGLGRVGRLSESVTLAEYAGRLRKVLSAPALRYVGDPATLVSKVALCSGSGASLLHDAVRSGADVLITGDVKYHEARDAEDLGLALIDAGHFPTEIIMVKDIAERLGRALVASGYTDCQVESCRTELDPFRI